MKFVLSLVAMGVVAFLYLQRAQQKTTPAAGPARQDFVTGFEQLFSMQCSADDQTRLPWCKCMLSEMIAAKAITPSMEDLEKSQAILARWKSTDSGSAAEKKCGGPSANPQKPATGEYVAEPPATD